MLGADWDPRVNVAGMPPYDSYVKRRMAAAPGRNILACTAWIPGGALLSYASSFVSWSPNLQNVEALVNLVASDGLCAPSQLWCACTPFI